MAIYYIKSLILVLLFSGQSIEFENLGCFYDYAESRTLPGLTSCDVPEPEELCNSCTRTHNYCENRQLMTVDLCLDLCLRRGFLYSGLEARQQCFCGNDFNSTHPPNGKPKSEDECNGPCRGNPSQFCGAEFRIMVYRNGQFTNCSGGIYLQNGIVRPSQLMYAPATTITFSCNPGFYQAGPTDSYCWYSGVFSHVRKQTQPSCTRQCEDIQTNIHNITLLSPSRYPDAYVFGDSLLYTCTEGYEPTQDDDSIWQIECTADGTWSTEFQSCSGVSCGYPTVPANGILLGTKFNYPNNISYECNTTGYVLEGNPTRHCQSDKTWSGQVPLCVEDTTSPWITIVGIVVSIPAIILIVGIVILCFRANRRQPVAQQPMALQPAGQQPVALQPVAQQPAAQQPAAQQPAAQQPAAQQPAAQQPAAQQEVVPHERGQLPLPVYDVPNDPDDDDDGYDNIQPHRKVKSKHLKFPQTFRMEKLASYVTIIEHDGNFQQDAIVHFISGNYSEEEEKAMKREIKTVFQLPPHPGVIRPIAEINDVDMFGICTENPKRNLLNYLRSVRHKPKDKKLINYALQIAEAMKFLHEQKKVCPMLRCELIMLFPDDIVKIPIIGLKHINGQITEIYRFGEATQLPVRWMSPEAITQHIATKESDVWTFGIVLYEILSFGDKPYSDINDNRVNKYIKDGNRPEKPKYCSNKLYAIMKECWQTQTTKRPTFDYLVAELQKLLEELNILPHRILKSAFIKSYDPPLKNGRFNYNVVIRRHEGNREQDAVACLLSGDYSEEKKEAMKREINTVFQLPPHPGVIRPIAEIDGGDGQEIIGICTEKPPNRSLWDCLNLSTKPNSVKPKAKELINYAVQIAEAMQFLHKHKKVCPMLRCELIMLFRNNIVKVPVIGLKNINGKITEIYRHGEDTQLPIRWMSPEAITQHIATKKSDVWAFGIVLYEIVTLGATPYGDMNGDEVYKFISDGNHLPKPQSCNNTLYALMKNCWHRVTENRPTFDNIVAALGHLQDDNNAIWFKSDNSEYPMSLTTGNPFT